jgi:rubrerythrin
MATIDNDVKGDEDDLEVIDRALEFEKKGFKFYLEMAQKSTNQDEKDFFNSLADEENVHIDILQTTHEYLQRPWDFFAGEERPIFEG